MNLVNTNSVGFEFEAFEPRRHNEHEGSKRKKAMVS